MTYSYQYLLYMKNVIFYNDNNINYSLIVSNKRIKPKTKFASKWLGNHSKIRSQWLLDVTSSMNHVVYLLNLFVWGKIHLFVMLL